MCSHKIAGQLESFVVEKQTLLEPQHIGFVCSLFGC